MVKIKLQNRYAVSKGCPKFGGYRAGSAFCKFSCSHKDEYIDDTITCTYTGTQKQTRVLPPSPLPELGILYHIDDGTSYFNTKTIKGIKDSFLNEATAEEAKEEILKFIKTLKLLEPLSSYDITYRIPLDYIKDSIYVNVTKQCITKGDHEHN